MAKVRGGGIVAPIAHKPGSGHSNRFTVIPAQAGIHWIPSMRRLRPACSYSGGPGFRRGDEVLKPSRRSRPLEQSALADMHVGEDTLLIDEAPGEEPPGIIEFGVAMLGLARKIDEFVR